ncbi:hypothetical protein J3R82DRAFT_11510 [Butyriboletus roseoflavus]|nr:hypothetical protein J3R82DRAFT_11510 [Butyriboletus roseoflavus]
MGFPLPDELTGLTFDHLDIPSLLRCMQVCKLFYSIISGSTYFRYKIELFASYMKDNEHSSMDTVNRLNLLREHNRVWNDMEWASYGSIPMCDGNSWEFSGGILAQSTSENQIFLVQLPCKLKGIAERRWSVPFDFRIRDFTLDNSQDLIVLLELAGNFPNMSCKLHLRTLSGEYHPHAAVAQITHALHNLHAEFSFLIQICGDHLAVLFYDQFGASTLNCFLIWNWRAGHRKVYIRTPEFQSFAFMTEDLILAAILRSDRVPTLQVLSVAAYVNPVHSLKDMPYICELQYPELQGTTEYFLIRSEPTPTWRPPAGSGIPFYSSRRDFMFTISMRTLYDEVHDSTVLIVPLSTLLLEVERSHDVPRRNVAWDAWGPMGTRMVCREPSETWVCYTYGMKFIHGLRWKNGQVARTYDFNPYATKKHVKTSVDSPELWTRLAKQSKLSSRCESFDGEVATALPGRVTNVTLHRSEEGWDAPMIGEDHILMVQPSCSTYGYMAM